MLTVAIMLILALGVVALEFSLYQAPDEREVRLEAAAAHAALALFDTTIQSANARVTGSHATNAAR